jgi:hypothetical protein
MPTPPTDRAALGRARLAERARRVARIRRNIVAATLAAFAIAWGAIVLDGSMGATTLASTATTTTPSASATSSAASPTATATPSSSSTSSNTSSPAPVTTSQS